MKLIISRILLSCLSLYLISQTVGCGGPTTVDITGTVTLDGKPLPKAMVNFEAKEGRSAGGITDEQGKYQLKYSGDTTGCAPGSYIVRISTITGEFGPNGDPLEEKELVPSKFNAKSTLTAEVSKDSNPINFDLTTK